MTIHPGDCTADVSDVIVPNVTAGARSGFGTEVFNLPRDLPRDQAPHEVVRER